MKLKDIYLFSGMLLNAAAGCMHPPERFTEKILVIGSKQSASISELGMTITNGGCGRKWMADNGGERPYCDLTVKMKDSTYHFGSSFDPLYIKNLKLVIDKMNPWGREEDSVPAGGCRIIVKRLDDLSR
ncbi:MAG: hypothetical protein HOP10_05805 [Chitinophagaceae bacterium]|nr:hypothetical protein [Chitinophagaceae bacterium]